MFLHKRVSDKAYQWCRENEIPPVPDIDIHHIFNEPLASVRHNMPCPVCGKNSATFHYHSLTYIVLDERDDPHGYFGPCFSCASRGWSVSYTPPSKMSRLRKIINRLFE